MSAGEISFESWNALFDLVLLSIKHHQEIAGISGDGSFQTRKRLGLCSGFSRLSVIRSSNGIQSNAVQVVHRGQKYITIPFTGCQTLRSAAALSPVMTALTENERMNQKLADELVKMMTEDQRLLRQLFDSGELQLDSYHPRMKALHEQNAYRLQEIIGAHGWPCVSLVGKEAAKAAWLVVQHSVSDPEFMGECVSLLEGAVAREDAEGWQLAFLQDRVCTLSGRPQYYGTQFDTDENGWPTPFPIEDSASVNERRARLGLNSLEERHEQMTEQERKRRANSEQSS